MIQHFTFRFSMDEHLQSGNLKKKNKFKIDLTGLLKNTYIQYGKYNKCIFYSTIVACFSSFYDVLLKSWSSHCCKTDLDLRRFYLVK